FFEDNHMIICTTPEQLSEWTKCEHFQIDLSFKRVAVAYQRIFHALFDLILQLTGSEPQFKHIHKKGWDCVIADLDYAKIREKPYNDTVKNNMYAILTAESEDTINHLFDNIQKIDKNTADWISFYRQKWVIASLNKCMSKIDNNIWLTSPDNTNTAEAAHALSNHRGKNLKLIEKDSMQFVFIKNTIYLLGDGIARNILSNKCQANAQAKSTFMKRKLRSTSKKGSKKGDVNNSDTEDEIPISHKQSAKKKPRKSIVVNSDTENDDKENELTSRISELEYKERVLALKEREIDLREREAKVYLMELSNFEKE
ncbi:4907_t:CDS:2, partial [Funneliformis mosseae]